MTVEILFGEWCNLFGDSGNVRFLQQCLPEAEFVHTSLTQRPRFADAAPDLLYMGPMSESAQIKVIAALRPHRDRLAELIDRGVPMLFIGNACEVLGQVIETPDGRVEGLGLLPFTAKQEMIKRYNGLAMGTFEGITVMGFRSQFTFGKRTGPCDGFLKVTRGAGLAPGDPWEGFRVKECIGTYLLGPILVVNPAFTHWLLGRMGADRPLPFEAELQKAYDLRLREFNDPKVKF